LRNNRSFEQKSAFVREKNAIVAPPIGDFVAERHYSPREVAGMLRLSNDKVPRTFQDEPGLIGDQSTRHKRRYTTLRIPESVLRRVLRRLSNV
jgi:hypothetical protein